MSPLPASSRNNEKTCWTTIGDRPIDGSSISSTAGRNMSARAISTCFCSPPDNAEACEAMRSATRGKRISTSFMRST